VIVDCHVYCFTAPDTAAGHATEPEHLGYWQTGYALHHQPAYRLRDRRPANSRVLLDPTPGEPLRLAGDRQFRVDRASNRLVWTHEGEDCTKQFLPPNVIEYSAGAIIAEMDYAGVDWGLIHVDATLGKDSAYLASCVGAYPDRLRSMAPIDERRISADPDAAIGQAHDAVRVHGFHALKIIPAYAYRAGRSLSFDDDSWRPFWDAVAQLGVPIFFTLGPSPGSSDPRRGFEQELWTLRRWHDRYPDVVASVTHGYPWRDYIEDGRLALSDGMWAPFRDCRLSLEVCMPVRIGDLFDFPYLECRPAVEAMLMHIGADRLLWGTDMPFQNRFCTYRQSRQFLEKYCGDLLSADDLRKLMGGTAAGILRI